MSEINGLQMQQNNDPIHIQQEKMEDNRVDFSKLTEQQKQYETQRTKEQIKAENAQFLDKQKNKAYMGTKEQMLDSAKMLQNNSELLLRDKKWYRFFNGESSEMKRVKEATAYLNNLLDENIHVTNGRLDLVYLDKTILPAYQAAFEACDFYLSEKRRKGQAKKTVGRRRYLKVENMLKMFRDEMENFKLVKDNAFGEFDLTGKTNMRELLGEIRVKRAKVSRFMPEGNSSNVYRVKVEGENGKAYFVKKDEKLIHENMPIYLKLRVAELKRSQAVRKTYQNLPPGEYEKAIREKDEQIRRIDEAVKAGNLTEEDGDAKIIEIRAEREELRLEGKIQNADYDNAIRFLEKLDQDVNGAESVEKQKAYIALLAHDYDKFFARLREYNANVEKLKGDEAKIDSLIATLREKKTGDWEAQVKELEKAKIAGLKQMNEWEWLESHIEELGLSREKNADVIAILQQIGTTSETGLSVLFTRSLGKEAELFGQHAERSGLSASDILASNNTATSRFAGMFGFSDVVTRSFKGKLEFTEVGHTEKTVANVTFSEEAPGEELLQVMEDAQKLQQQLQKDGKCGPQSIVKFSKQAARQMSRMHTFDLITLQTDRHWRNIKAKVTKKEGNPPEWIIESVKCYDHDQSFGNKDLKEYFADIKDEATGEIKTKKEGFLSPIMMTVSKSSNLYKYAKSTRMTNKETGKSTVVTGSFLDNIQIPQAKTKMLQDATAKFKKSWGGKDQYTNMPWDMLERTAMYFNWADPENREKLKKGMKPLNPGKEKVYEEFFKKLNLLTETMSKRDEKNHNIVLTEEKIAKNKEEAEKLGDQAKSDYEAKMMQSGKADDEGFWEQMEEEGDKIKASFMSRKDVLKLFRDVVDLYNQLDCTNLEVGMDKYGYQTLVGDKNVVGFFDYNIQGFFHLLKVQFSTGEENVQAMKELEEDDKKQKEKEIKAKYQKQGLTGAELENAVKKDMKAEAAETVRLPAVLHMDRAAYDSVVNALNSEAQLDLLLKDLGMTQDKKDALKRRLQQIVDEAAEAQKVLNEWADMQGLPPNAIERKFLLDENEWDQINSLTDLALDPGMSYYSSEDSQFLTANADMNKYMTEAERQKARAITNDERNTQRQRMGNLEGNYIPYANNSIARDMPAA